MTKRSGKGVSSLRVRIYNAAQLLKENFSLDSTLREIVKVIGDLEPVSSSPTSLKPHASERSETSTDGSRSIGPASDAAQFSLIPVEAPRKDHRHQRAIAIFCRLWSEHLQGKYVVQKHDGPAISRLIKQMDPEVTIEEIERRMVIAFGDPWFIVAGSIAVFVTKWNQYSQPLIRRGLSVVPATPQSKQVVVGLNADGSPKYAERRA